MRIKRIITNFEKIRSRDTAILIVNNEEKPKIIYADSLFYNWHQLPKNLDLEGMHVSEIPHDCAKYADAIDLTENIAMKTQKKVAALTTSNYSGEENVMLYSENYALTDELGEVIGCGVTLRKVQVFSPRHLFLKQPKMHATFNAPNDFINDNEWNVLYLTLIGFSRNEIANILNINKAAVNYRLESCINKTGTTTLPQLLEYAFNQKWDTYIPHYFIQHGHIRLL